MNWQGVLIGAVAFFSMGIFHPIVIKAEYYFSKAIWPVFLIAGIVLTGISLTLDNIVAGSILAVIGFSFLWSIYELFEQEKRVQRGWFPENPERMKHNKK